MKNPWLSPVMLFTIILTQEINQPGSAQVPLLIVGVLLGWAAAPAWTELVLKWPNRVGGISTHVRRSVPAVQPHHPPPLTGACYWWGWIPTCT